MQLKCISVDGKQLMPFPYFLSCIVYYVRPVINKIVTFITAQGGTKHLCWEFLAGVSFILQETVKTKRNVKWTVNILRLIYMTEEWVFVSFVLNPGQWPG